MASAVCLLGWGSLLAPGDLPAFPHPQASTPVVGGIVALINDWRLQRGLPALGFLNPALYRLQEGGNSTALYDVSAWGGCSLGARSRGGEGQPVILLSGMAARKRSGLG